MGCRTCPVLGAAPADALPCAGIAASQGKVTRKLNHLFTRDGTPLQEVRARLIQTPPLATLAHEDACAGSCCAADTACAAPAGCSQGKRGAQLA